MCSASRAIGVRRHQSERRPAGTKAGAATVGATRAAVARAAARGLRWLGRLLRRRPTDALRRGVARRVQHSGNVWGAADRLHPSADAGRPLRMQAGGRPRLTRGDDHLRRRPHDADRQGAVTIATAMGEVLGKIAAVKDRRGGARSEAGTVVGGTTAGEKAAAGTTASEILVAGTIVAGMAAAGTSAVETPVQGTSAGTAPAEMGERTARETLPGRI
eukprot:2630260-Prymnesium_polylepis.1